MTVFEGVPTMYAAMLHHPRATDRHVRRSRSASPAAPRCRSRSCAPSRQRFGCEILEGYGLSETSPVASFNRRDRERKPGSIGLPVDGVEMRVVDDGDEVARGEVGEIAIRGHNVMKGYWRRPEATAEAIDADGWFRTGDIGRVDEDGYFFIVDRKKELVIRGGFNVYPREIEEVLYEHPAVARGRRHRHPARRARRGGRRRRRPQGRRATQRRRAARVRQGSASPPTSTRAHVWLVDELPKGPTGKILKREITPADAA